MKQAIHLTIEEEAAISLFFSANGGNIKFTRNMDTVITRQPANMGKYVHILREREDERHGYYGQFYIIIDTTGFSGDLPSITKLQHELAFTAEFLRKLSELTTKKIVR